MVSCPPKWSLLYCGVAEYREKKLTPARGLEGSVGKVSVVKGCDSEHPYKVECDCYDHCSGAPTYPQDGQTTDMYQDERDHAYPVCRIRFVSLPFGEMVLVKPANHRVYDHDIESIQPKINEY